MSQLQDCNKALQKRHPGCYFNDPFSYDLKIGDYGWFSKNGTFVKEGNIYIDHGESIPLSPPTPSQNSETLMIGKIINVDLDINGQAILPNSGSVKAGIGLEFEEENNTYIHYQNVTCSTVQSPATLKTYLINLIKSKKIEWYKDYVVIHELYEAENIKVIVSKNKKSIFKFLTDGSLSPANIKLDDASINFSCQYNSQDFSYTPYKSAEIFFKTCRIKSEKYDVVNTSSVTFYSPDETADILDFTENA